MKYLIRSTGVVFPVLMIILVFQIGEEVVSSEYDLNFIPWGKPCKIAQEKEFLNFHESCDDSKGLSCKQLQHSSLCGCSKPGLTFDLESQECRIKPLEDCLFVNRTKEPEKYERLTYPWKCHNNSECTLIGVIGPPGRGDSKGKCLCMSDYELSFNRARCVSVSVNHGDWIHSKGRLRFIYLILIGLITTTTFSHFLLE